jgi:hypothetical protein
VWGSEERARRRRAQELERRLQELDRIDALYGLGTMPHHVPQPRRRRRSWLVWLVVGAGCWWAFSNGYVSALAESVRSSLGMEAAASPWDGIVPWSSGPDFNPNAPAIVQAGGSFEFNQKQPSDPDSPITFDPCEPINVVVNDTRAPAGAMMWIAQAIANAQVATGMTIVLSGTTEDDRWEDRGMNDPVLISWATEAENAHLTGSAAGVATPVWWEVSPGVGRTMTGSIVLDLAVFNDPLVPDHVKRAIVQHELSHVLGLGHVNDPTELMNPTTSVYEYGPGDLEGLARIGNSPCG